MNAPTREKVYAIASPEFGWRQGQSVIIKRVLHGIKSSRAAWRAHLAGTLDALGFHSNLADPDVFKTSAERKWFQIL